ncbi:MAG: hypothetical protein ACI4S2_00960 [Lachnospiraceae bacterium]
MGSLILCHKKRAKQAYEITRVHIRIYTIEELCYYVCNNLYLIDYTIMNRQLCEWLASELDMAELADKLGDELSKNCSEEQFVLTLLRGSDIYAQSEINKIQGVLESLQNQKEVEKTKYKADTLLESGEYSAAILVYQSIIHAEWDDSVEKSFYGHIYGCLGSAYGRLFLYEEAALAYKEAYQICEETDLLKAYLYCCYKAYPEEEYVKMLSGNSLFLSMDSILKEQMKKVHRETDPQIEEGQIENWKNEYRRIDNRKRI